MGTYQIGDKVIILDIQKVGEVVSIAEDGSLSVKYTDDGGAEQTETVTADKLAAAEADEDQHEEKSDEQESE